MTIKGLLTAATGILAICSIAGFLSRTGHIPELLSHFRLHYLIGAMICLTIFVLQKDKFRSLAAGLSSAASMQA
ncbi:hypothetical protein A3759_08465 [Thalassolituus sp. HI0120]|nr:hypothetical protein A3759_24310 [Thalassolituus sp. HI0120]KZZ45782.1 hypothetical protein A3759_08465 [Thalassolituus sp. HI0120]